LIRFHTTVNGLLGLRIWVDDDFIMKPNQIHILVFRFANVFMKKDSLNKCWTKKYLIN
jgi:hypothetical protein